MLQKKVRKDDRSNNELGLSTVDKVVDVQLQHGELLACMLVAISHGEDHITSWKWK